jgi:uncharacterized membrane protein YdjX (TVP38/TMEM64 family)
MSRDSMLSPTTSDAESRRSCDPEAGSASSRGLDRRRSIRWARIGALVALTGALVAIGHATGAAETLSRERIEAIVHQLGVFGFVAYVAIFALGELVHVPGMVFVAAAILVYGRALGFVAAFAGAMVSLSVSFWVVRLVGGQPLGEISRPWAQRMLAHLDRSPVATVAILRALLWLAPALNYALAMTRIRFRDYVIGSALGLVVPLAIASITFDWLFS